MKIEIESVFDAGTINTSQFVQIATDHSKAAYASLLQVPDSEQANKLGEALGELLFPERSREAGEKPQRLKGAAGRGRHIRRWHSWD
jgi:hypothetical protein